MAQYALTGHVFVCLQGEHVVFLDVLNDRYFCLEAARTASLGAIVPGWPVAGTTHLPEIPTADDSSPIVALLVERGLLSLDARSGKSATPVCVDPGTSELTADTYQGSNRAGVACITRFTACAVRTSFTLRFRPFARVVERVRLRNQRHTADAFDEDRAHRLIAMFTSLRPFFFTAKDMCLFETLALSEFLAQHDLFPRWVFGVRARPFAAHCWLQHGAILLNDTLDHIGRYTPIMVV